MANMTSLQIYRRILRAAGTAFKGDAVMLPAARLEIRNRFEENRNASDAAMVLELQTQGEDAAEFIRDFVVQAAPNARGNLSMALHPRHADTEAEPVVPGMHIPRPRKSKKGGGGGTADPSV